MAWLKLTKKALHLMRQNSNESIEEVKVKPYKLTEDRIEEFPTRWFEGSDAPKTMIISNNGNEYEPQSIEKGAIKLKILEKLKELYPDSDIYQKLRDLSLDIELDILVLAFYSTFPISKEKLKESSTQEDLRKICQFLGCEMNDLKEEEEKDIPLFKFDIDLHIKKYYQNLEQFIEEVYSPGDGEFKDPLKFIDLLRTQYVDIYLFTRISREYAGGPMQKAMIKFKKAFKQ